MKSENFSLPDAELQYFPDFLSNEKADFLFEKLLKEIPWQQQNIKLFGNEIPQPRLTAFYAEKGISYTYSGLQLQPETFSTEILGLKQQTEELTSIDFNTCLVNLYRDGRDSMGWHADNEKVLGKNPVIASISLGGVRSFQFKHKNNKNLKEKIELQHGSLLIMKGSMQHFWKHQLPKTKKEVSPRINLTFRKIQ
ncbi:alpha-ketoglutarate-dependent dioxygenase AlkB family protein [Salegentibacter salegens]|uniref:Alkylated DNA repair dioxygenase AlkB n=1 Tax=Salegentibacter salegens TaxID=143223 RepID=A0A1M7NH76_9FLAO|nr:alpha-ketoglutarate-dependent dioxygenase AlkB [Salegentibacter salegens]PRX46228.1 alkylated DNA repair dioxygenase AlkB [Salegentibacter salegens]SHN03172.1 Alkylated DNA repair dioxygenase AlkB [Salegentibacter salegens]